MSYIKSYFIDFIYFIIFTLYRVHQKVSEKVKFLLWQIPLTLLTFCFCHFIPKLSSQEFFLQNPPSPHHIVCNNLVPEPGTPRFGLTQVRTGGDHQAAVDPQTRLGPLGPHLTDHVLVVQTVVAVSCRMALVTGHGCSWVDERHSKDEQRYPHLKFSVLQLLSMFSS